MNRALPFSLIAHLVFLVLMLAYGAWVKTPEITLPHSIAVSIRSLDRPPPEIEPETQPEPEVTVPPEPVIEVTEPEQQVEETTPIHQPEADPEIVAEETRPPATQPETEPVSEPEVEATLQQQQTTTSLQGQNITVLAEQALSTEQNIVLQTLVARISEEWQAVGPEVAGRSCVIRFSVDSSGALVNEHFVRGSQLLKSQALLTVRRVGRINPHGWIGRDPWNFTVEMIAE